MRCTRTVVGRWLALALVMAGAASPGALGADADQAKEDAPILGVVLLRSAPAAAISDDALRAAVERAWNQPVEEIIREEKTALFVVDGQPYLLNNVDAPYFPLTNEQIAEMNAPLPMKMLFQQQKAWLSVDLFGPHDPADRPEAYRKLSKLAALFADDEATVGVHCPEMQIPVPYDARALELLRDGRVLELFADDEQPNVVQAEDEQAMDAAIAEAQRTLPEFEKAFRAKADGTHSFTVKWPLVTGDETEFIWVEVFAIEDGQVDGRLANEPAFNQELKVRDRVQFPLSDSVDWLYVQDGQMVGGYTVKVLQQQGAER